jgi:hypothetical protein
LLVRATAGGDARGAAGHSRLDGRVPWIKDAPEGFDLWEHIAWAIVRTHRAMHAAGVLILKGESE